MIEKEFAEIIDSTKGVVLSAIEKHLAGRFYHAIDDVVQETYIRAYKSLVKKKFRGDSKIETWLYTIARNESLRMDKKLAKEEKKYEKSVKKFDREEMFKDKQFDDEIDALNDAIGNLPEKYRAVMELTSRGLTEKEIAEKLNIKHGTVKSRISRGKEMIQKIYREAEK